MISYLKYLGPYDRMYPYRVFKLNHQGEKVEELILKESEVTLNIRIKEKESYKILDTRVKSRRDGVLGGDSLINLSEEFIKLLKIDMAVLRNVEKIYFILEEKNR